MTHEVQPVFWAANLFNEEVWQPVSQALVARPVEIKKALVRTDSSVAKVSRLKWDKSPLRRDRECRGWMTPRSTGVGFVPILAPTALDRALSIPNSHYRRSADKK